MSEFLNGLQATISQALMLQGLVTIERPLNPIGLGVFPPTT